MSVNICYKNNKGDAPTSPLILQRIKNSLFNKLNLNYASFKNSPVDEK